MSSEDEPVATHVVNEPSHLGGESLPIQSQSSHETDKSRRIYAIRVGHADDLASYRDLSQDAPVPPRPPDVESQDDWEEAYRLGPPPQLEELSDDGETILSPSVESTTSEISFSSGALQARDEIKRLTREFGRDLDTHEIEIIYAKHLEGSLNALDRRTLELYQNFDSLTHSKTLGEKIGGLLVSIVKRAGGIIISAGAGMGLRTLLHGLSFGGGIIAGSIVGTAYGAYKGRGRGEKEAYGAEGYLRGYEDIINDTHDESDRRANGLAYLEQVLSDPDNFKGNHSELMRVLSRYRQDALVYVQERLVTAAEDESAAQTTIRAGEQKIKVDNNTVAAIIGEITENSIEGRRLVDNYRKSDEARGVISRAVTKGAIRGLKIGAGAGLLSDVLGWGLHEWATHKAQAAQEIAEKKAAGAYREAYLNETKPDIANVADRDYLNVDPLKEVNPGTFEHQLGFSSADHATDYGNALSHALKEAHTQGQLGPLPPGMTEERFNELVHAANFAQSNPQFSADVDPNVQFYHFDHDNLRNFVDKANDLMRHGNEQGLSSFIKSPESILHPEAHQTGLSALDEANKAFAHAKGVKEAVEAASPISPGEAALHGAAIGGITGATSEYLVKHHDVKVPGEQAQQEPTPAAVPTQPPSTLEATPATSSEAKPTNETATEAATETQQEAQEINFEAIEDYNELVARANETLSPLEDKKWSELSDIEQKNIDKLLICLKGKASRGDKITILYGPQSSPKGFVDYWPGGNKQMIVGKIGESRPHPIGADMPPEKLKISITKKQGGQHEPARRKGPGRTGII